MYETYLESFNKELGLYTKTFKVPKRKIILDSEGLKNFRPDLLIYIPSTLRLPLFPQVFSRHLIAVEEYGYNNYKGNHPLVSVHLSGMKGLGIFLDNSVQVELKAPFDNLLQLPEVYQQAIFNNDLNQFKQKDIFYFGYAEGSRMLSWFLRMIAKRHSQKTSEGAPKKILLSILWETNGVISFIQEK